MPRRAHRANATARPSDSPVPITDFGASGACMAPMMPTSGANTHMVEHRIPGIANRALDVALRTALAITGEEAQRWLRFLRHEIDPA